MKKNGKQPNDTLWKENVEMKTKCNNKQIIKLLKTEEVISYNLYYDYNPKLSHIINIFNITLLRPLL